MTKALLAIGAAAVALSATPADARRHYTNHVACARWHHGRCVAWHRLTVRQARRAGYRVGYVFGPNYSYTAYNTLPRPYVTRYHLSPDYRYVYNGNTVYVVDPTTYAITRILSGIR
jgi:hypothetical protein